MCLCGLEFATSEELAVHQKEWILAGYCMYGPALWRARRSGNIHLIPPSRDLPYYRRKVVNFMKKDSNKSLAHGLRYIWAWYSVIYNGPL